MYECNPVQYMADVVAQAIERHNEITISKNSVTKQYSASEDIRLLLHLNVNMLLISNLQESENENEVCSSDIVCNKVYRVNKLRDS